MKHPILLFNISKKTIAMIIIINLAFLGVISLGFAIHDHQKMDLIHNQEPYSNIFESDDQAFFIGIDNREFDTNNTHDVLTYQFDLNIVKYESSIKIENFPLMQFQIVNYNPLNASEWNMNNLTAREDTKFSFKIIHKEQNFLFIMFYEKLRYSNGTTNLMRFTNNVMRVNLASAQSNQYLDTDVLNLDKIMNFSIQDVVIQNDKWYSFVNYNQSYYYMTGSRYLSQIITDIDKIGVKLTNLNTQLQSFKAGYSIFRDENTSSIEPMMIDQIKSENFSSFIPMFKPTNSLFYTFNLRIKLIDRYGNIHAIGDGYSNDTTILSHNSPDYVLIDPINHHTQAWDIVPGGFNSPSEVQVYEDINQTVLVFNDKNINGYYTNSSHDPVNDQLIEPWKYTFYQQVAVFDPYSPSADNFIGFENTTVVYPRLLSSILIEETEVNGLPYSDYTTAVVPLIENDLIILYTQLYHLEEGFTTNIMIRSNTDDSYSGGLFLGKSLVRIEIDTKFSNYSLTSIIGPEREMQPIYEARNNDRARAKAERDTYGWSITDIFAAISISDNGKHNQYILLDATFSVGVSDLSREFLSYNLVVKHDKVVIN